MNQFEQIRENAARILDEIGATLQTEDKSNDFWGGVGAMVEEGEKAIRAMPLPEVRQEPILYQYRLAPDWYPDQWSEWKNCSKEAYSDYTRMPRLNSWTYETRILYSLSSDTEALRAENERLRKELASSKVQEIYISAAQLRMALEFVSPDEWQDENEQIARISNLPANLAPIGDNGVQMKAGLYVCDSEYPEEGWIALFDDADNQPSPALKGGA